MPFDNYYAQQGKGDVYEGPLWQSGGAIRGYAGRDLQYGRGLGSFGRAIWKYARPILKYLGKTGIKTGVEIGSDVLAGKPVQESVTDRLKTNGAAVVDDAANLAKKKLTGRGKMARKRRAVRKHKKAPTRRKRTFKRRRSTRRKTRLTDIFT